MSVHYLKSLLLKSARIQKEIDREAVRPWPDSFRLLKLKKMRLMIRDRMERLCSPKVSSRLVPVQG